MKTLTLKNIPPDLYERLRQSAELNRRSINSEVLMCIERSLLAPSFDMSNTLARIRVLREKTAQNHLTEIELSAQKEQGRS